MQYHQDIDLIDDTVRPEIGSIKEVRIDGILDKKTIWTGTKWQTACRYLECKEYSENKGLCRKHYSEQISSNIKGEIKTRGSKQYIWDDKQWRLLCTIELCQTPAENVKTGRCRTHNKNPDVSYSGTQRTIGLFHQIKTQMDIEKKKNMIKSKKPERKSKKQ
jgi:hypothetical protein